MTSLNCWKETKQNKKNYEHRILWAEKIFVKIKEKWSHFQINKNQDYYQQNNCAKIFKLSSLGRSNIRQKLKYRKSSFNVVDMFLETTTLSEMMYSSSGITLFSSTLFHYNADEKKLVLLYIILHKVTVSKKLWMMLSEGLLYI